MTFAIVRNREVVEFCTASSREQAARDNRQMMGGDDYVVLTERELDHTGLWPEESGR